MNICRDMQKNTPTHTTQGSIKIASVPVSVIVPIYNVESYLPKCLASIQNQDKEVPFELILVNDGSTDSSGSIAAEFANGKDWVTVVHQPNGGLSAARNTGIEVASGEYLMFIDSDDYVSDQFVSKMYDMAIKLNVDVLECSTYRFIDGTGNISQSGSGYPCMKRISGTLKFWHYLRTSNTAWNKIYKRSIFINNHIRYPNGLINEDFAILYSILYFANSYARIDMPLYYYRCNRDGAITYRNDVKIGENFPKLVAYIANEINRHEFKSRLFILLIHLQVLRSMLQRSKILKNTNNSFKASSAYVESFTTSMGGARFPRFIVNSLAKIIHTSLLALSMLQKAS